MKPTYAFDDLRSMIKDTGLFFKDFGVSILPHLLPISFFSLLIFPWLYFSIPYTDTCLSAFDPWLCPIANGYQNFLLFIAGVAGAILALALVLYLFAFFCISIGSIYNYLLALSRQRLRAGKQNRELIRK